MATSEAPPSYSAQGQGAAVQPLVMIQGGAEGIPQGVTPVVMVSALFRCVSVARPVCLSVRMSVWRYLCTSRAPPL